MASEGTVETGLAARYAAALFDLADESQALDQTASDLVTLKALLAESDDLRRLVRSPVLSRADQGHALDAVLEKAGSSDLVRRFVGLVAHNRRLFALSATIEAFLALVARRRGEVTAQVVSAQALTPAQLAEVSTALNGALGAKVSVAASVDPALLGGMIVKVGSRMIDSSVRTKLAKLKIAMKGVG